MAGGYDSPIHRVGLGEVSVQRPDEGARERAVEATRIPPMTVDHMNSVWTALLILTFGFFMTLLAAIALLDWASRRRRSKAWK